MVKNTNLSAMKQISGRSIMPHHTKKVEINLGYACNAQMPFLLLL